MNLVLQSQAGSCPIAPGTDLTVAISLLQMSVLGLPLLLALFQFVNDHEYPEPEETVSKRTVLYGLIMMTSALMLWRFYHVAFCMIQSQLDATQLTNLLFVFMWVMLAIILAILWIQLEQMAGEGARYPLITYLFAFLGIFVAQMQTSRTMTLLVIGTAVVTACMGVIAQFIGLETARERTMLWWKRRQATQEKSEGMEGMESVYK